MPTLGFSYVLKLLSMNEKPQRTEIKKRLLPSGGGYDFHDSLRRLARRLLVEGAPLSELLKAADKIKQEPERNSVKAALKKLALWRASHPGELIEFRAVTFAGPGKLFKIRFAPDFGLMIAGRATAVHLWNTKRPPLIRRMTLAALSWLPRHYENSDRRPDDFAVLSLQDGSLTKLSEARDASTIGAGVIALLEQQWERVRRAILPPPPEDRPPPPIRG
jgi:hypothetical protein